MLSSPPALSDTPPPTPAWIRRGCGVLSVAMGLSSLALLTLAWTRGDQPYWLLSGMELCLLVASVFGLLFAKAGRYAEGPAMALACIAGTFFAPAVLGWLSLYRGPGQPVAMALSGNASLPMTGVMVARVAIALSVAILASVVVLRRNRASLGYVRHAAWTGALLGVLVGGLYGARHWLSSQTAVPEWIVWTLVSLAVIAALALFCAAAHCVIRAFEVGRTPTPAPGATSS